MSGQQFIADGSMLLTCERPPSCVAGRPLWTGRPSADLLVIDPRVSDWPTLAQSVPTSTPLLVLDPQRDGVAQIVEAAGTVGRLSAIHIVSHASPGQLELGSSFITHETMADHVAALRALGDLLDRDSRIFIYGCRLAQGNGAALVQMIARATRASVTASLTDTGAAADGGDWDLAYATGSHREATLFSREARARFCGVMAISFGAGPNATLPSLSFGTRIITADFNNDGKLDLLFQNGNTSGAGWGLALGNGDGTFATPIAKPTGSAFTTGPLAGLNFTQFGAGIQAEDLDGDGRVDLIDSQNGAVPIVYHNTGSGFVQVASPFASQAFQGRMLLADFNNDGFIDVLAQASNTSGSDYTLYLNRADGSIGFTTIAKPNGAAFTSGPLAGLNFTQLTTTSVYAVDLNGDGKVDIVDAQGSLGGTPAVPLVYQNTGSGFTSITSPFAGQPFASRFVFGDFNSDGYVDVLNQTSDSNGSTAGGTVVSGSGISVYLNAHSGSIAFTTIAKPDGGAFTSGPFAGVDFTLISSLNFLVGDFDGDGDTDLIDSQNNSPRYLVQGSNSGGDGNPPTLVSTSPADNAGGVAPNANIVLTFDETVTRSTGTITIVRTSDNSVFEQFSVTDARVTGSGTTWTINPAGTFTGGTQYAVRIDPGAFVDSDNAWFMGIRNNTTLNFTVQANTPPTLAANSGLTLLEGGTATITAANLDFNDAEQADTAITYTLTTAATNGSLLRSGVALASGGTFTQDDITNGRITFTHNGGETTSATFGFSVSDGAGGTVTGQSFGFTITPVNDAPMGADATFTVGHGTLQTLATADFGFSDVEGNAFTSVTIDTLPSVGRLLYASPSGAFVAVTVNQVISTADIAAGRLAYKLARGANDPTTANFTFQVHDNGGTANGGVDTDPTPNTLTFVVQPNQAPHGADATIAVTHGTAYILGVADFGFGDPEGDAFTSVTIDTLPSVGRLLYATPSGALVAITANQIVSTADIMAGKLVYKPAPGANDPATGSFTFQVHDNGGTAGGGVDTDPTPNTITFNASAPQAFTAMHDQVFGGIPDLTQATEAGHLAAMLDHDAGPRQMHYAAQRLEPLVIDELRPADHGLVLTMDGEVSTGIWPAAHGHAGMPFVDPMAILPWLHPHGGMLDHLL